MPSPLTKATMGAASGVAVEISGARGEALAVAGAAMDSDDGLQALKARAKMSRKMIFN